MKRRFFARRRHAESAALIRLKLLVWLVIPAACALAVWQHAINGGLVAGVGFGTLAVAALVYPMAVLRVRDLTGEWRFF